MSKENNDSLWLEQLVDQAREVQPDINKTIVVASGVSPSGHIHLGNMREVITSHLVAEHAKAMGFNSEHLHSWDDYDVLRKVPAGQPDWLNDYLGVPLSLIPDPGDQYESYGMRFISEFQEGTKELMMPVRWIRQSQMYTSGVYNKNIRLALEKRKDIFNILESHRTKEDNSKSDRSPDDYYPFIVYCEKDNKSAKVMQYNEDQQIVYYHCPHCENNSEMSLADGVPIHGKLVWKVDWPMRWFYEDVAFEPGGPDHASPGSSFTVGKSIVTEIFGGKIPGFTRYAFVGLKGGSSKMSSSKGTGVTPLALSRFLEPAIIRWIYTRTPPTKSFELDLSPAGISREYDRFETVMSNPPTGGEEKNSLDRALKTSMGDVAYSRGPRFSTLASTLEMVGGDQTRAMDILTSIAGDKQPVIKDIDLRFKMANAFIEDLVPQEDRILVLDSFNSEAYSEVSQETKQGIDLLLEKIDDCGDDVVALEKLLYAIPKQLNNLPEDSEPTDELKAIQRQFFADLYMLLLGKTRGPRLSTLLSTIDPDKRRKLLKG